MLTALEEFESTPTHERKMEMVSKTLTIPCLCSSQGGKTIYQASVPVRMFIKDKIAEVDVWNPELKKDDDKYFARQGYQRSPQRSRLQKVAKYIRDQGGKPLFPNTILLCSRGELDFVHIESESDTPFGYLHLDITGENPLWIVDGQHRVYGFEMEYEKNRNQTLLDYELLVVIVEEMTKYEEVFQFYTINTTAKGIRTDLSAELLLGMAEQNPQVAKDAVGKGQKWRLRATDITRKMMEEEGSPWFNRIKLPNQSRSTLAVASATSFSASLKPVLTGGFTAEMDNDKVVKLLKSYWCALEELMPEAFADAKNHSIQKTPGMYVMHLIAPRVFELARAKSNKLSMEVIESVLEGFDDSDGEDYFDSSFWESGGDGASNYNSMGAFRQLADAIKERLPEVSVEIIV